MLSTVFAKAIVSSECLPMIINLNSTRLAKAYRRLTTIFDRYGICYLPCDAGHFVLAKLVRKTETKESAIMDQLNQAGVLISPGYAYHIAERGWTRVSFAVRSQELLEAIKRMKTVLVRRSKQ